MGEKTTIAWTDHTFSPWYGCAEVSAACDHCYARDMARRFPDKFGIWGHFGVRVPASERMWRQVVAWNRAAQKAGVRRRVFCGSMCDVFEARPELVEPRRRLFRAIDATPWLDWLLLTKRPENIARLMPPLVVQYIPEAGEASYLEGVRENVWLGATIENPAAARARLGPLLGAPAARRFLSIEPLLGPIDLETRLVFLWARMFAGSARPAYSDLIHEIILGGESGPAARARPCRLKWIRDLLAHADRLGIAAFVKQLGSSPTEGDEHYHTRDRKGADPSEWPADLAARAYPAKGGAK